MRGANIKFEVYHLACRPGLDVGGVVGEFVSLAEPNITGCCIVVGLRGGDLELALDVAVGIGCLVVVHLRSAGRFHSSASETRLRRSEETVSRDGSKQASGRKDGGSILHLE